MRTTKKARKVFEDPPVTKSSAWAQIGQGTASELDADTRKCAAAPKIGNRCRVMLSVHNICGRGDKVSEILGKTPRSNRLAFEEGRKRQRRSGRILGNEIADRLEEASVQRLVEVGRRHQRRDPVVACVGDQKSAKQSLLQLDIVRQIREEFWLLPVADRSYAWRTPVLGRDPWKGLRNATWWTLS